MDETWQMRSTFKTDEDNESFGHYKLILGPKMAYFCPPPQKKTVFLAYFGIIEGIAILFQYPKWIEFGIQDQLLGLKKIKTVSNIPDSFWGQKWPIFAPKTAFLANFGIIEGISILFKIQNG